MKCDARFFEKYLVKLKTQISKNIDSYNWRHKTQHPKKKKPGNLITNKIIQIKL
jgi:hypothetical protein